MKTCFLFFLFLFFFFTVDGKLFDLQLPLPETIDEEPTEDQLNLSIQPHFDHHSLQQSLSHEEIDQDDLEILHDVSD